jgi:hypothetical protein
MMRQFGLLILFALSFITTAQAFETGNCYNGHDMPLIEQVIINDQGVCLLIGNSWLVTNGMQASNEGMFVLVNEEWMPIAAAVEFGDFQASWKCSKCGSYSMDGVNTCPYCGKPKNG